MPAANNVSSESDEDHHAEVCPYLTQVLCRQLGLVSTLSQGCFFLGKANVDHVETLIARLAFLSASDESQPAL